MCGRSHRRRPRCGKRGRSPARKRTGRSRRTRRQGPCFDRRAGKRWRQRDRRDLRPRPARQRRRKLMDIPRTRGWRPQIGPGGSFGRWRRAGMYAERGTRRERRPAGRRSGSGKQRPQERYLDRRSRSRDSPGPPPGARRRSIGPFGRPGPRRTMPGETGGRCARLECRTGDRTIRRWGRRSWTGPSSGTPAGMTGPDRSIERQRGVERQDVESHAV